jgi:hypothetical protein
MRVEVMDASAHAKAKLFLPASAAPTLEMKKTQRKNKTRLWRLTFGSTSHFLISDYAELMNEVAIESALTTA